MLEQLALNQLSGRQAESRSQWCMPRLVNSLVGRERHHLRARYSPWPLARPCGPASPARGRRAARLRGRARARAPGSVALIGTIAKGGPERCSGLPCARHDAASLLARVGGGFELIDARVHTHHTPWGL